MESVCAIWVTNPAPGNWIDCIVFPGVNHLTGAYRVLPPCRQILLQGRRTWSGTKARFLILDHSIPKNFWERYLKLLWFIWWKAHQSAVKQKEWFFTSRHFGLEISWEQSHNNQDGGRKCGRSRQQNQKVEEETEANRKSAKVMWCQRIIKWRGCQGWSHFFLFVSLKS